MTRHFVVSSILAVLSTGAAAQEQAGKAIDYETYCKLPDAGAKKAAFNATTAEIRGMLARTQIERWRDANQARLDDKQKAVLAELIQSITSDSYAGGSQGEKARVKTREVIARFEPLFTRAELMAMQPDAPCLAKKRP